MLQLLLVLQHLPLQRERERELRKEGGDSLVPPPLPPTRAPHPLLCSALVLQQLLRPLSGKGGEAVELRITLVPSFIDSGAAATTKP